MKQTFGKFINAAKNQATYRAAFFGNAAQVKYFSTKSLVSGFKIRTGHVLF